MCDDSGRRRPDGKGPGSDLDGTSQVRRWRESWPPVYERLLARLRAQWPDGRGVRLAHTHSLVDENQEHDYWAEPHASANAGFTRIVFTSN